MCCNFTPDNNAPPAELAALNKASANVMFFGTTVSPNTTVTAVIMKSRLVRKQYFRPVSVIQTSMPPTPRQLPNTITSEQNRMQSRTPRTDVEF